MARAEINAGICGFKTAVVARKNGDGTIQLTVESDCKAVSKLADQIQNVEPYKEAFWRRKAPTGIYELAPQCLSHPACPVPCGIIKAMEVEAGLALPADVSIKISTDDV